MYYVNMKVQKYIAPSLVNETWENCKWLLQLAQFIKNQAYIVVLAPLNTINNDFSKIWSLKHFFFCYFLVQNTEINKNLMSLSLLMEETQTFNHKTFNKKLLMIPWWLNCFVFASDMFCNYFFCIIAAKNLHKLKNQTIILPFSSIIC